MQIDCKKATELLSDSMHRRLTRWERFRLGVHMTLCTACRLYRKQVHLLRAMMREGEMRFEDLDVDTNHRMPDEVRERIAAALRDHARE